MKKLRIGSDMDGMFVDVLAPWLQTLCQRYNVEATKDDIKEFRLEKCPKLAYLPKGAILDVLHEPDFFLNLPEIPGGTAALEFLHRLGHDIHIVTALPSTGERAEVARTNKRRWIEKRMPWMREENIIFAEAQEKAEHPFDVFLDDRPDTLIRYSRRHESTLVAGIMYPYNREAHAIQNERVRLAPDHHDTVGAWSQIVAWIDNHARRS